MSRVRDGWEYANGQPRWAPTVEVQMANMLVGKYGEEYEEARRELDDLVRAAQRDASELLRKVEPEVPEGFVLRPEWLSAWREARDDAADLVFPDYPDNSDIEVE